MMGGGGHGFGGGMGGGMGRGGPGGPGGGMMGRLGEYDEELGKPYDHKVMSRLLRYVRPYKMKVIVAVLAIIAYSATVVALPWLVRLGIDAVTDRDAGRLNVIVGVFVAAWLIGWAANYVQMLTMARITQGALYDLRTDMFRHLHRLSMSFYDKNEVGRVMSRVQNDVSNLQEFLQQGVASAAELLALFGIVGALFYMNWQLALVTLAVAPALILCLVIWQRRARPAFINVRRAIARVNADLNENISGVRVVQSLNRQDKNSRNFDQINQGHLKANFRAALLSAIVLPLIELLMAASIALVIIYGGWQVLHAQVTISVLVAFVLYIQRFFDPIRQLTMMYTQLQQAMASGSRVFEFLDTPAEIVDAPDAIDLERVQGDIRFDHVYHRYTPQVEVLHDIDLHIRPGETVALVGETGAGKTTITALIPRLYECSEGSILIDGHDVRRVKMASLTRHIAMVLQDPFLFSDTVRENIRYGRLEATDEEVREAAKIVGADEFIHQLDEGYDTLLTERGGNLSVGQRQLISFARAVLANPRILILDEATANIDTYTERLIQRALHKLLEGRTSVVIAHRLSTIRNADRIVVLERGRVQETGTHDELMAANGIYHRLYTMNYQLDAAAAVPGANGSHAGKLGDVAGRVGGPIP